MSDWRLERRRRQRAERHRRRAVVLAAFVATLAAAIFAVVLARRPPPAAVRAPEPRPAPRHPVRPARKVYARSRAAVPILMYHVIAAPPVGAPFPGLYVTAADFGAQMRALRAAGFRSVTMNEMLRAWRGAGALSRHPIVISFDNGYRTQYTHALPILRRLHWVGVESLQLAGLPPAQGGLTRRNILGLKRAGWEIDTQGLSHADLPALDPLGLTRQITEADALLWRLYRVRPHWFCYPSGRYDAAVVAAVHTAGFVGATTVVPGWARPTDDLYRLPRLRVLAGTSPAALLAQIRAARDAPPPPETY